ncbi:unnamed protein product, partial [Heterotrigona itama]
SSRSLSFHRHGNSYSIRREDHGEDADSSLAEAYTSTEKERARGHNPRYLMNSQQPASARGESFYGRRDETKMPVQRRKSSWPPVPVATRVQEGKTRIFQCGTREGKKKRGRRDEQQQLQREEKEQKGEEVEKKEE